MMDPESLEVDYKKYMTDLKSFAPDGIVEINLSLLQELGLLSSDEEIENQDSMLAHNFYVVESSEKLTLFNQKFVVWIVPKMIEQTPTTITLIALAEKTSSKLEMVFTTTGIYNHSNLVLRILEKFLEQIEENEEEMNRYNLT